MSSILSAERCLSGGKWLQLGLIVLALAFLGSSRQLLLVNINSHLSFLYYEKEVSYVVDSMEFIKQYSYQSLMWGKWYITIAYTLVYLLCTILVLKILSFDKGYVKLTLLLFGCVVVLSGILYGGLNLFGEPSLGYRLARFCMGLVQSPIPLMVLVPAYMLAERK